MTEEKKCGTCEFFKPNICKKKKTNKKVDNAACKTYRVKE